MSLNLVVTTGVSVRQTAPGCDVTSPVWPTTVGTMKHRVSSPTTTTLTKLAAKRRWSAAEAQEVLGAFERSGEEPAEFAARHGIHPARLGRWLRARPPRGARAKVQFAEIHLAPPATTNASVVTIEIERGRVRIAVLAPERCPPAWTAALAQALAEVGA